MPGPFKYIKIIIESYAQIIFASCPGIGLILAALTFYNPHVGAAGLIAVLSAHIFAKLINFERVFDAAGQYTFNPLLVGLGVGYLFRLTPMSALYAAVAGVLALLVTIIISSFLISNFKLPVLSLPFSLVSIVTYLAASKFSTLNANALYEHHAGDLLISMPVWADRHLGFLLNYLPPECRTGAFLLVLPDWADGFFRSLGTIFYQPSLLPGMAIALLILFTSRILFMMAVAGYFTGTVMTGLLSGNFSRAFSDIYNFNYILIAMAIGGVFLIPSIRSYVIALIAVALSAVLTKALYVFLNHFGLPIFSLPFNLITFLFLYGLGFSYFRLLTKYFKPTPEETLDHYLSISRRFGSSERTMSLPFSGKWTVWQGFDGEWTHKAALKYAYDFIIFGEDGKSFSGAGAELKDYYAFQKSILSPVRGTVARVISGYPDNPIGLVDKVDTWGNYVVILDARGFYVAVSHLMYDSIPVREGDWVEKGTFIGKCGNSGYSPQPHIHVQAQSTSDIKSETLPFDFVCYINNNIFISSGLPPVGAVVEPLFVDKSLEAKTSFMIGDHFKYDVMKRGRKIGEIPLTVKSAADGTFYFESENGALYFGKFDGAFYAYRVDGNDRLLKSMFVALPRMPLGWRKNLSWTDSIPANVAYGGLRSGVLMFFSSFNHGLAGVKAKMNFVDQDRIEGKVGAGLLGGGKRISVELDEYVGFRTIKINDLELRRKNETVRG